MKSSANSPFLRSQQDVAAQNPTLLEGAEKDYDLVSKHESSVLNSILTNWFSTLFAYQPEVYQELDLFRRHLNAHHVSHDDFQKELLRAGVLQISVDHKNKKRLYLKFDPHIFSSARDKLWVVDIHKNGSEFEYTCMRGEDPNASEPLSIH